MFAMYFASRTDLSLLGSLSAVGPPALLIR